MAAPKKKKKRKLISPIHRGTKFKKLRALNCFAEVLQQLKEGYPTSKVAGWIQEDQGEYQDVGYEALRAILAKFRDTIPPAHIVQQVVPSFVDKQMTKVEDGFDELAELQDLYRLQMKRVDIDFKLEESFKKLMPSVTQEIRTAREILSTIAELKMDLGLNDRKHGTINVDARIAAHVQANFGNAKVAGVLANAEKRQRLTGIVKLLAKKADKPPIIVVEAPVEAPVVIEGDDAVEVISVEPEEEVIVTEPSSAPTQGESAHP